MTYERVKIMDENVTIYRQYIVDISGVGLPDTISSNNSRSREKSENIGKYHRYIGNISVMGRHIKPKIGQICSVQKNAKKKTKNKKIILADILANISPIDFFVFFIQ